MRQFFKRKGYTTDREAWIDLPVGFFGWYALNSVLWLPGLLDTGEAVCILGITVYALNFGLMIAFGIRQRRALVFAFMAAMALNLFIGIVVGMFYQTICFVPFYLPVR